MKKRILSLVIVGLFILFVSSVLAETFANPSSGLGSSQYYQPSFNSYYSSEQISTYWPILDSMKNGQCQASNDFLVAIPPLGCTPTVVRSDLLEEQNVPVFCQLDALQVNPLIKVSSIESISFKGDYPSNVAGISFHPARAAVNTRENLLGSPLLNNIGYVVIILKRTPAEKDMPETVKGNLTATIRYDAEEAFGVGQAEFLLPFISDENWSEEYKSYGFWNGKGYARLLSTDGETAEIGLYTDGDRLLQKVNLKKGETSNEIFFPGLVCNAGLQVRLNSLDAAVDKVRLSVGDEVIWATKGTKFLNGKCQVKSLIPSADGTGSVSIYCPGSSTFNLILSRWGALFNGETKEVGKLIEKGTVAKEDWYLAYVGNLSSKISDKSGDFAILIKSDKELDAKYLARAVSAVNLLGTSATKLSFADFSSKLISKLGKEGNVKIVLNGENGFEGLASTKEDKSLEDQANVQGNFTVAKEALDKVFEEFGNEQDLAGSEYAKKALVEYARAAGELGQYKSQKEALEMLIEKYPASLEARNAETQIEVLGKFDITNAGKGVYVNNKYSYILAEEFKPVTSDIKNVDFNIKDGVGEGDEICVNGDVKTNTSNCPFILVKKISPTYVDLTFADYVKGRYSNKSVRLYGDSTSEKNSEVLGGTTVYVREINVEEEVSISILPRVDNTKTEANFTFNIGIEKRSIELSPAKTEQMIKTLNKSISDWQDRVDKLGKLVTAWKGACFATSAFMVMSNFASGLSGESIARKDVMAKYKLICEEKVSQRTYSTLSECYNAMSTQIDTAVKTGTDSIGAFNEKAKAIEKASLMSDGKTINQTLLKNNLIVEYKDKLPASAESMTTEQIKEYLFWNDQSATGDAKLKEQAIAQMKTIDAAAKQYGTIKAEDDQGIVPLSSSTQLRTLRKGTAVSEAETKLKAAGINLGANQQVQVVSGSSNQKYYVIIENESATSNRFVAKKVYAVSAEGVINPKNLLDTTSTTADKDLTAQVRDATDIGSIRFVTSSCDNPYKEGFTPTVKYYAVGVDKYLPSLVPFDQKKGWFVKVSQGGGGILSSTTNAYQASGIASTYTICNIGSNQLEENGLGDDICQTFYANNDVDEFGGCYGMTKSEVTNLKNKAQRAIQEAANQYGKTEVIINGQKFGSILSSATDDGLGCYQFMSPSECKTLFNVCDPVICPPSRCNLGGKYPVSNVIQSGIIGSLLLCLPNVREGIVVPVCLTGVHAGLETYLSILKSEKACLQENLESGKNVGICDEITSVYKCEFFWNQIAPVASSLVPTMFEMATGQKAARGGAEYMSVKSAWENMQGSIDYFKNSYAQNSFNAFKFKNIQEVGSEFCRANLGTSVPGGADLADGLLAPESPYQFYANFDESVFSEATLPSTSQYKVYYHIFAGNDQGVRYSVYLQNPPDSAYYHSNPIVTVKTGYVTKGESADEAIDFTAPSGYKELCVMINAKTECGFKTVSTSMAANYLTDKYVADQAKQTGVASEKECISGSSSVLALATSPNLQAGAQGAVNPDVSLNGIVRVCATDNPGKSTNPDRWKQVGNCGNEKMLCWLDTKSVNETVSRVDAVEGISLSDAEKVTSNLGANTKESYATIATKLVKLEDEIKAWKKGSDSSSILTGLSDIIDGNGASNNQLANALYLKTMFHLNVVKAIKVEPVQIAAKPTPGVSTASEAAKSETLGTTDYTVTEKETLRTISTELKVNINDLYNANKVVLKNDRTYLTDVNKEVPVGTTLIIPN